jgi:hypothetical protein
MEKKIHSGEGLDPSIDLACGWARIGLGLHSQEPWANLERLTSNFKSTPNLDHH